MRAIVVALLAGTGTYLLVTAAGLGWRGGGPRATGDRVLRRSARDWLAQAGLPDVPLRHLAAVVGAVGIGGAGGGYALFGAVLPAAACGAFAATAPVGALRRRRRTHLRDAQESWPRLIEEIRVLTTAAGRSVPQALFEAGSHAPSALRPAFERAQREWLLTTDFARTVRVLKDQLADPTADMVCETLLVAHHVGGTDLERRLAALAADRRADTRQRREAHARQAGARFARRFVLIVPIGMALAGLSVGEGRAAYQTPLGQALVLAALLVVVVCWWWAGRIMHVPEPRRVLAR